MPLRKTKFNLAFDNLPDAIDVDDSAGRSVPINMNFIDEGYLSKDTGSLLTGDSSLTERSHSLFLYKKKDGRRFLIRGSGTKLQYYAFIDRSWYDIPGSPTFTEDEEFGFATYDDILWGSNRVEGYFKFDGDTFTQYPSAPKGNDLTVFEDRMFVTGVEAEPLSWYYSDVATPQTFQVASVVKPLGTDFAKTSRNYYGVLLLFKAKSIWKLEFIYDQVLADFIPKLSVQSKDYGTCSRKAVASVENDLWFFTGLEVRAIGFQANQIGVLGVDKSVISNNIKETLKLIDPDNYDLVAVFYEARRFYLSVPLAGAEIDCVFVCHLLYANAWTKYIDRDKATARDYAVVDEVIYTTASKDSFGVVKWTITAADALPTNDYLVTE